ncbi:MAG: sulfotransferase [Parvularculaceae bacterium]|nr:sulfotransferase [Parvularculaceae bacterium]
MEASDAMEILRRADGLAMAGRRAEAVALYREVLAHHPDQPDILYNLGLLLGRLGRFDEALGAYDEALRRGIDAPEEVHLNRAVICADHLRREADAEVELREAIRLNPAFAPAILNLGNLLEERGERDEAIKAYQSISPPADGFAAPYQDIRLEALARLAQLQPPARLDDPLLRAIEAAAKGRAAMGAETRANLNYALGRSFDALGAYDRAIDAFHEANRHVRKAGPAYDRRRIVAEADSLIVAFSDAAPATRKGAIPPRMIFICGMFRSGSTLVEQALAAHPDVIAGGELNLLNRIADVDLAPYPQSIRTLNYEKAQALAARYRADIVRLFPDAARKGAVVTDKRPDNFLRIGLIKRLFPDAKIVHTVRDPVDTCLSVYFQHIDQGIVGYASDLADAGHYFGEYRRMMAHWKSLYPKDIFDFDYDGFVVEPRKNLEALLAFLDLSWSEDCLAFHRVKNTVKTASYWQVRRPLYRDSSGRRRHYEPYVAPLIEALKEAGVAV